MFTKLIIAGTIAAGVLFAASPQAGSVLAQYPAPQGSCVVTTTATTATSADNVTVTVIVRDANGKPVPNMPVTLAVTKQPGTGATVTPTSATTNSAGMVTGTLKVGTATGAVEVTATPTDVSCRASVVAGSGEVAAQVALPNTGDGGSSATNSTGLLALTVLGAGVAAAGIGLRRREQR